MDNRSGNGSRSSSDLLGRAKQAKEIWEILAWVVSSGTAIVTFVRGVGGPVQFLVEVGVYGFACYVAVWVILPAVVAALTGLENATGRATTDLAAGIAAGTAVLGGGALIRFGLFHPNVTKDLDGIGTAFGALVGLAVLAVPLVALWYFRGSTPAKR